MNPLGTQLGGGGMSPQGGSNFNPFSWAWNKVVKPNQAPTAGLGGSSGGLQGSLITSMGQRAKSPADTVPATNTTLPAGQLKTMTPVTGSSTENGTQASSGMKSINPPPGNPGGNPNYGYNFGGPQQTPPPSVTPTIPTAPTTTPAPTGPYTPPNQGTTGVNQGGIIGNLLGFSQNESPQVAQARSNLQSLQNEMAQQTANIQGSPIDLSLATGQQGILGRLYATKLDAAQQALASALQSQGQQIGAAGTAGQLNTQIPYGQAFGQGSGNLQSIGNLQGQVQIGQDVAQQNAFLGSAQATGQNLQDLITQNNINPSAFTPLNGLIQLGANYTSNPAYQKFQGQINDFITKIAPILGGAAGATTDYKTQLAGGIINAMASGQSIKDVISYFLNQAQQNIKGYSAGGGVTTTGTQPSQNTQGNTGGTVFGSFF